MLNTDDDDDSSGAKPQRKGVDTTRNHTVDAIRSATYNLLGERYEVDINSPLPELSNDLCRAYAATDRIDEYKRIFALIGVNGLPFRDHATDLLQKATLSNLIRCHATGAITLSDTKQTHRGYIFQRPAGKKLSAILQHSGALPEHFIINQIIRPLSRVISELEENGVNHGSLNPNTVFYDKDALVNECCALPSGYLQIPTYEAPERLIALEAGKGAGDIRADYYAMGILVLHLYLGYLPHEKLTAVELYEKILQQGAYNTFIPEVELSDAMQDFFRGTINENRNERWTASQLKGWLSGKKYSIVAPSIPRDSVRPFEHRGTQYYTRRQIAHGLSKDWRMARTQLSGFKLLKWLESNLKKTDVCTQVERIIPIGDDEQPTRALKDDELARLLSILDPVAPVRYKQVAVNVDGIGPALADAYRKNNTLLVNQIFSVIESNLLTFVDTLPENTGNPVSATVMWRLQNLRPIIKAKGLGFGADRILYQLNPTLSCQHPLLLPHYVYTLADVMNALHTLAAKHAKTTSLIDANIAAFITDRLDMNREVRIIELSGIEGFVSDERLVMLKILTLAQQKLRNIPLPGITQWATEMILPIVDALHQKSKREKIRNKVLSLVDNGILEPITFLLLNKEMFQFDRREYSRADALSRFHKEMLVFLQDNGKLKLKARIIGQQTAWFIGVLVLSAIIYSTTRPFL